jgi:hypothetical protein
MSIHSVHHAKNTDGTQDIQPNQESVENQNSEVGDQAILEFALAI